MNEYGYGWEKLHTAIGALTGASSQRQRLVNAVLHSLLRIKPDQDLPANIREEFKALMERMQGVTAKGGGSNIEATIHSLDDSDVRSAVEQIVSFYATVCRYEEPDE